MKIIEDNKKRAFEIRFSPEGGERLLDFVFAESYDQAEELAGKMFARREIIEIVEVK